MADTFTPERIAQLRKILAKHSPPAVSCAMENLPAALDEIERLRAERDAWKENAIACGKMLQSFTPSGSEYFGKRIGDDHFATDEKACGAVIRSKLDALHKARCEAVNTARELSRVTAERDEAGKHLWAFIRLLRHPTSAEADVCGPARAFLARMEGRKDA